MLITIERRATRIRTSDGKEMYTHGLLVAGSYLSKQPIGPVTDIQFRIQGLLWDRSLQPSESVRQGVIQFLNQYHNAKDDSFDCYAFAMLVNGLPHVPKSQWSDYWTLSYRRGELPETVFLMKEKKGDVRFFHAAVRLSGKFYISVYGAGGQLEVSTIPQMLEDFEANFVLCAEPIVQN